jgi:hypothetical protein
MFMVSGGVRGNSLRPLSKRSCGSCLNTNKVSVGRLVEKPLKGWAFVGKDQDSCMD